MTEEIRKEILAKIEELEWRNNLRSLEMIEWLNWLLKKTEVKEEKKVEPIRVELEEEEEEEKEEEEKSEEKKVAPKRKIVFKKK